MLEKNQTETLMAPYVLPSALVTVVGLVVNLFSLSYFVIQRNNNSRLSTTEIVNKRLFILLNSSDICVCIAVTTTLIVFKNDSTSKLNEVFMRVFIVTVQSTGFITCTLGVIRVISITRPQLQLNIKFLIVALISFVLIMIILEIQKYEVRIIAHFIVVISLFVFVIFSNTMCILILALSSQIASWKWDATVTIGLLSIIYCIFNVGFVVQYGRVIFECNLDLANFCTNPAFELTSLYILIPLNSVCNPIVYFIRNRDMRNYAKNMWRRIFNSLRLCGNKESNTDCNHGRSTETANEFRNTTFDE
jgi:hypothetical protein